MTGSGDLVGGTVTRAFIEDYTAQLDMLGDEAEDTVLARLGDVAQRWLEMREDGMSAEEIRAYMREEAGAALMDNDMTLGAASVSLAVNSLYVEGNDHGLDLTSLGSADVLSVVEEYARKSNSASARHWARLLDGTDEGFNQFLGGICAKTRRNITHAADRSIATIAQALGAKDKGVRYARVPQGPSCGFCMMLASRGFVYVSRESAGAFTRFHDHCDCHVIAGREGIEVEGYHPEIYLDAYVRCRDALGGNHRVWEDFCALSPEERDRYGRGKLLPFFEDREREEEFWRKYGRNANAFNDYYMRRIVTEMDTRDREWVYTGRAPEATVLKGASPNQQELRTARLLSDMGFRVEFRPTRGAEGKRTSDIYVVTGYGTNKELRTPWEFKEPDGAGNGRWTINHQFEDAAGQSTHLVIDITDLELSDNAPRWNRASIEDEAALQVSMPFRVKKGSQRGATWAFDDVTLVSGNDPGYCVRYSRRAQTKRS